MNFFEHQERARTNGFLIVVMFVVAVVAIIVAVDATILLAFRLYREYEMLFPDPLTENLVLLITTGLTLFVIGLGSLYRIVDLSSGGGVAVARLVKATRISTNTVEAQEKQLLNVVEEMAIASGVNVPGVWVMDSDSINAFAAGYSPAEATIVVSRGCLNQLNRDELQGVIAHEFSHIFNGDMRTNIRMLGVLSGILIIGNLGLTVLRGFGEGGGYRSTSHRSDDKKDNSGAGLLILLLVAVLLAAIGYIGVFCARAIKAALSRSREFLADASAVQFTRNPEGIAGALQKIHASPNPYMGGTAAEELSHFFFSDAVGFHSSLYATHPPLEERLDRISPKWRANPVSAPRRVVDTIGSPTEKNLASAHELLDGIPSSLQTVARHQGEAELLLYALLALEGDGVPGLALVLGAQFPLERISELSEVLRKCDGRTRLAVANLAIATVQSEGDARKRAVLDRAKKLVAADGYTSTFEGAFLASLERAFGPQQTAVSGGATLNGLRYELSGVVALIARTGQKNEELAAAAYQRGMNKAGIENSDFFSAPKVFPKTMHKMLNALARARPKDKEKIVEAFVEVVMHDGEVLAEERELLRTIALAIDVPVPLA